MTFSVAGRDERSGLLGVAICTARLAIGGRALLVRPGLVVATQGTVSWALACDVAEAVGAGSDLSAAVAAAAAGDALAERRQLLALGTHTTPAAFSGAALPPAAGQVLRECHACAGNQLASPAVLEAVDEGFERHADLELPERLVEALVCGQRAGGDRRGQQSAALRVVGRDGRWPGIDLRVDDDPDPLERLAELLRRWRDEWGAYDATGTFPPARPARLADGSLRP